MTEAVENLVLEHLRHLRGLAETTLHKVEEPTIRVGRLEDNMARVYTQIAGLHTGYAPLSVRMDGRLDRIERRFGLIEA